MVVRRTIHHMRQRSREERIAFATMVAATVTGILFIGWAAYLFISLRNTLHSSTIADSASSTVQRFDNASAVLDGDTLE